METKSFGLDRRAMAVDMGCDVHLESGVAGGTGHRQAMRDEIPILGDQIDQARRAQMTRPRFRAARRTDLASCSSSSSATAPMM